MKKYLLIAAVAVSEMAVYRAIELFLHKHLGGKVGPEPGDHITSKLSEFREAGKIGL